jgi:hypothetical protein
MVGMRKLNIVYVIGEMMSCPCVGMPFFIWLQIVGSKESLWLVLGMRWSLIR